MTEKSQKAEQNNASYDAKDIYVLEGLDPVRKRPGMYIGTTGPDGLHHLIWECLDNSIDEVMAGFAKSVKIELLKDSQIVVSDDGRGIPVDIHPQTKKSALETVMTTLHAGGKFGGESYKVAGGLHGVGISVVNALSKWMRVEVCRGGNLYAQEYHYGKPKYKVKIEGKCAQTGTKVIFSADPKIFQKIEFDQKKILDHLRQQAFLNKGVKIEIIDERNDEPFYYAFHFEGGLLSFIRYLNRFNNSIQKDFFYAHKNFNDIEVESVFVYNQEIETKELGFANNIYTPDGGTHITGFRSAITRTLNDYARSNNYLKESDDNLTGDDVREGLTAIVSVKLREPQFEGQTKARLGNPEARTAVESVINESLKEFLEKRSGEARPIIEKCLLAAKARKAAKAARETVLRKGVLEGLTLPGKLADCSSRNASESELFIVEGDSAGGCWSGNTKVALTDGRNLTFKELAKEDKKGKKNYCYTMYENGHIGIAPILSPRITRKNTKVIKIILDNKEELICTSDHLFRLVDGSYIPAVKLTSKCSLAPLYRRMSKREGKYGLDGYEMVFDPKAKKWMYTHILADMFNLRNKIYIASAGKHRHHIDFNKLNNNPINIQRVSYEQHMNFHYDRLEHTLHRLDVKIKAINTKRTDVFREKARKKSLEKRELFSKNAKKQWHNEEYKNYMTQKFLEFYKNNSEYREKNSKHLNDAQKMYWSNIENKNKQARRVKDYFEKHPEKRKQLSVIAKKQWLDLNLRKWRSEITKKQWTSEFREKRIKAYNQTYLKRALEVLHSIYQETNSISNKNYNRIRRLKNDKTLIRYDTICQRFFNGSEEKLKEAVLNYNHRVKTIILLKDRIDVYDIEVPKTHNFALASGVFVHNSSKMARDRRTQAILPLRGKILNIERARVDKMLANKEVRSLVIAIGTAIGKEFDISKLRYHKIILMTDADVDGSHIRTLLLTLFYRYFVSIIESGHLYIAQPPLYRIQSGKEIEYAYTELQKQEVVSKFQKIKNPPQKSKINNEEARLIKISIQRYKGLGEMNPDQLWETTMDSETRILKLVTFRDAEEADKIFDILMGTQVEPRRHFIQSRATMVKNLDV